VTRAPDPAGPPALRKWYFCINAKGFADGLPQIAVAVASARANTALEPVCIYDGGDPAHTAALRRLGVQVVAHRSSFEDALRRGYGAAFETFCGHWLRVDLPLIEREEAFVLYTDIDVMFLGPPKLEARPRLLAAAPEFDRNRLDYFSSGVMVMNLPALRECHSSFVAAIRARLAGDFRYPAHDQESFNRFFGPSPMNRLRGRVFDPLDPVNNWKPFWGIEPDARIVHFHGPKSATIRAFERCGPIPGHEWLVALWQRDPAAYAHYATLWEGFLAAVRSRIAPPRRPHWPPPLPPLPQPSGRAGSGGRGQG
jgi:hypothetical protein